VRDVNTKTKIRNEMQTKITIPYDSLAGAKQPRVLPHIRDQNE